MKVRGNKIKYDVESYLSMLRLSGRGKNTIDTYRKAFVAYARFLDVPLDQVHHHLSVTNLLKFADRRKSLDRSEYATKGMLSILRRYCTINGIVFDEMEYNAVSPRVRRRQDDKPITHEILQKMMDLTDEHGKAVLSFKVSTGVRPGEAAQVILSDFRLEKTPDGKYWQLLSKERGGDTVIIRNEIAKGGRGGTVYLTDEAMEYINLWLRVRDQRIRANNRRARALRAGPAPVDGAPDTRQIIQPRKDDQRMFAASYSSIRDMFDLLYDRVDGEQGKYRAKCTPHSCRKYFRTQATLGGLPLDIVEHIMRHEGYLTSSYVRLDPEEVRRQFHKHEQALYITRPDQRRAAQEVEEIRKEQEDKIRDLSERQVATERLIEKMQKERVMPRS